MRTLMLGGTGAGKTTYMASLFDAFHHVHGTAPRLRVRDAGLTRDLLDIAASIRAERYPDATAYRVEYPFQLESGGYAIDFVCTDYRGGDVTGDDADPRQVDALLRDVATADGVMLFADASELTRHHGRKTRIGALAQLLGSAVEHATRPIALSVLLTKFDLVANAGEALLRPLAGLIETVALSPSVTGALIPVVCGPTPRNVGQPLFFSLEYALDHLTASRRVERESSASRAQAVEHAARNQGILGALFDEALKAIFDEPTTQDRAVALRRSADAHLLQFSTAIVVRDAVKRQLAHVCRITPQQTLAEYAQLLAGGSTATVAETTPATAWE
jgi:hypothetical protein